MVRIASVNIPDKKCLEFALQTIYGIGPHRAKKICSDVFIDPATRVHTLSQEQISLIRDCIEKNFVVETDLRKQVAEYLKRKIDRGCYQGIRHRRGLPVRGQRTRTNARTRKGKRVAIPGKKK